MGKYKRLGRRPRVMSTRQLPVIRLTKDRVHYSMHSGEEECMEYTSELGVQLSDGVVSSMTLVFPDRASCDFDYTDKCLYRRWNELGVLQQSRMVSFLAAVRHCIPGDVGVMVWHSLMQVHGRPMVMEELQMMPDESIEELGDDVALCEGGAEEGERHYNVSQEYDIAVHNWRRIFNL